MATIKSPAVIAGSIVPDQPGCVLPSWGKWTYTDDGGGAVDDVIQMCPVPASSRIIDILVEWSDGFDGSATFDVGDGDDDDRFYAAVSNATNDGRISLAGGTVGGTAIQEGPLTSMSGFGYTYDDADTIDITTEGGAAATGDAFTMCVLYSVEHFFADE
uniref:Putative structural protein n=1 Tax=viral metagenome TaxID=1070528 RepID=A0A6M3JV54_9ZZZZ